MLVDALIAKPIEELIVKQDESTKEVTKELGVNSKELKRIKVNTNASLKLQSKMNKILKDTLFFFKDKADDPITTIPQKEPVIVKSESQKLKGVEESKGFMSDIIASVVGSAIVKHFGKPFGVLTDLVKKLSKPLMMVSGLGATLKSFSFKMLKLPDLLSGALLKKGFNSLADTKLIKPFTGIASDFLKHAPLGKLAGSLAKKGMGVASKIPIVNTLIAAYEFQDGFRDANEIFDLKPSEKVGLQKKMIAGLASVVDTFTFGLVDEKKTAKLGDKTLNKVENFFSKMFSFGSDDEKQKKSTIKEIYDRILENTGINSVGRFFGFDWAKKKTSFKPILHNPTTSRSIKKNAMKYTKGVEPKDTASLFNDDFYKRVEGITDEANPHHLTYTRNGKTIKEKYKTYYGGIYDNGEENHKVIERIQRGEISPIEGYKEIAKRNANVFYSKHEDFKHSKPITKKLITAVSANAGGSGAARSPFIRAYTLLDNAKSSQDVERAIESIKQDRYMTQNHKRAIAKQLRAYGAKLDQKSFGQRLDDVRVASVKKTPSKNQQEMTRRDQPQQPINLPQNHQTMINQTPQQPNGNNINSIDNFTLEDSDPTVLAMKLVG